MKRFGLIALFSVLLAFSVSLAGCNSDKPEGEGTTASATVTNSFEAEMITTEAVKDTDTTKAESETEVASEAPVLEDNDLEIMTAPSADKTEAATAETNPQVTEVVTIPDFGENIDETRIQLPFVPAQ